MKHSLEEQASTCCMRKLTYIHICNLCVDVYTCLHALYMQLDMNENMLTCASS